MNCTASGIDLSLLDPREIDRMWAEAEATLTPQRQALAGTRATINRYSNKGYKVPQHYVDTMAKQAARLADASRILDPFKTEWEQRGGWRRFELCLGGHVHRHSPRCSSLHPTSATTILAELTDLTERTVVERMGFKACTICFPWAPTVPAFQAGEKAAQEAEAAKNANRCDKSGTYQTGTGRQRYVRCAGCGSTVSLTPTGALRAHNKPKAKAAK